MTTLPRWDLADLFASTDDPRLFAVLDAVQAEADVFAARCRGRLATLSAAEMCDALAEYERLRQESARPIVYAGLRFAADTAPENGALLQKLREKTTAATLPLLSFDIELARLSVKRLDELAGEPTLANYAHYLTAVRDQARFRLSEPEERVIEEMANTGRRAWVRLFEETMGALRIDHDGRELSLPEALDLQRHPDRNVREGSAAALSTALEGRLRTTAFLYNTILQNHATENRLRGFAFPEESQHVANELPREIVETVVALAEEGYPLAARYYAAKRRLLGLPELRHYDRYAPVQADELSIPYETAKDTILAAFDAFDPVFADAARQFFASPWIDAEPRKGKRGGAFCNFVTPDLHPYILMSYLGKPGDVKTLAHELGHGVHALLSRQQSHLNFHGTLPMAEVASTFAEMLVADAQEKTLDADARRALYAHQIESSCATIFRQAALYRFEQTAHGERARGELSPERLGAIWQEKVGAMFGETLRLGDDHASWWSYVSHFFASPFYVYAYTFGEMLALALFHRYRQEGAPFAQRYVAMLAAGGSRAPGILAASVGVDLADVGFWRGALTVLESRIAAFETLADAHGA